MRVPGLRGIIIIDITGSIIDSQYVSFELYEDREWNDLRKYAIADTIVDFVRKR